MSCDLLKALEPTISAPRLSTYLKAAGHDEARALTLYIWNVRLGEAFHLPIQAVEIGLRNRVNEVLVARFGSDWWRDDEFLGIADGRQLAALDDVKARIEKRKVPMVTGQVVAGLSFGFWVSVLGSRFNPTVWGKYLRSGFPDLPRQVDRRALQASVREIADFRNRISHHEPVFKDDISQQYAQCLRTLGWICASKAAWVKPQCTVMTVLRAKP